MFSLKLLGGLSLTGDRGPLSGRAVQRYRLALLALLGASNRRNWTRDKLMAWLWPERDGESARGLLNQAVHTLRLSLGPEAILSLGEELQLNPAIISCDAVGFDEAIAAGDLERAAALYAGPFLDGFFLSDAPEFERWAEQERERLAGSYGKLLESLADKAWVAKDWRGAADWWKLRVAQDPYDSRAVTRLMLALEASGHRAAALVQADAHQRLLKEELELEPAPEVRAVAERLRAAPASSTVWLPPESAAVSREPAAAGVPAQRIEAGPPAPSRQLFRYGAVAIVVAAAVLAAVRFGFDRGPPSAPAGATSAVSVDQIAQAVAQQIERLRRGESAGVLPQQRTRSIPAYELYLRGSDPVMLRSDSAARLGLDYLRQAVALDSNYAAAWASLARMTMRVGLPGDRTSRAEVRATARAAGRKALALNDSLAEAHATLGLIQMMDNDLAGAETSLQQALALDPDIALHREWLVKLYIWSRRTGDAVAEARRALQLAPLTPTATAELARALLADDKCDEALAELDKLKGLQPQLGRVPGIAAQCYARKRMWPEALALVRDPAQPAPGPFAGSGFLGYFLARAGRREEATQVLSALLERVRAGRAVSLDIALLYLGLEDRRQAVHWLELGVEDGSVTPLTELAPLTAQLLDSLRTDPRIARIRQRVGLQNR